MGCLLWGRTESDTTEATQQQQLIHIGVEQKLTKHFKAIIPPIKNILINKEKNNSLLSSTALSTYACYLI